MGTGKGQMLFSPCLLWHDAPEPGENWNGLQPFSARIAFPGLFPWAFDTFLRPCSPSYSPSMSSQPLSSTPQGYGFLLPCLHPAPKQQKKWGRKRGFFWTVSFLKNWDQCCFKREEWTAGTKQGCRMGDADSITWDGMCSGASGQDRALHSVERYSIWEGSDTAAWQGKELLTATSRE